jgi:hypothetical protein
MNCFPVEELGYATGFGQRTRERKVVDGPFLRCFALGRNAIAHWANTLYLPKQITAKASLCRSVPSDLMVRLRHQFQFENFRL